MFRSMHAAQWVVGKLVMWVDFSLLLVLAGISEVAMTYEIFSAADIIILHCLIGGIGGSSASIHFYPPANRSTGAFQFGINTLMAAFFSPAACEYISYWTKYPVGLRLALPVSFIVGLLACQAVARAIPWLQRYFDTYAGKVQRKLEKED